MKMNIVPSFVCVLLLFISAVWAQVRCDYYSTCKSCTEQLCTWCTTDKTCIPIYDPCERTDTKCDSEVPHHYYLIGITLAGYVIMIGVMLASVKFFYFPRRSRLLARHTRRTNLTDITSFATNATQEELRSLGEAPLWCDVSMANIWLSFGICVSILVISLPISIVTIIIPNSIAGWLVSTLVPLIPSGIFIFYYCKTDQGQFSKLNILTTKGAYIITTGVGVRAQSFTPYSSITRVDITEANGGRGNVVFATKEGKTGVGFYDIPAPYAARKIVADQLVLLAQSGSAPVKIETSNIENENAPLLGSHSAIVL